MGGTYALQWTNLNTISGGQMQVTEVGPDDYEFRSRIAGAVNFVPFDYSYRGTIRRTGQHWYVAITYTNDPAVGRGPVRNDVSREGNVLTFRADTGLVMSWRESR
jgi:hypothetical protein